jgi:hypothetical protein
MNTTEKEVDLQDDVKSEESQEEPLCQNGVCELNWQPKRPQAA